ncbi:hypothetical protein [Sporomusa aerivorans]|uniref:hypothetical protein n=1 Tax=Sporomusa aerivorans TaxID=204936 RepID=UPI00352B7516
MKDRLSIIIGSFLYVVLLTWTYIFLINPSAEYFGFTFNSNIPIAFFIVFITLAILPSLWLPIRYNRVSQILIWLIYILVYIPTCLVPMVTINVPLEFLLLFVLCLLISLSILQAFNHLPLLPILRLPLSLRSFWFVFLLISFVIYIYIINTFGIKFQMVSLFDVYDIREQYKDALRTDGLVGYAINWASRICNGVLFVFGLYRRNILLLILGLFGWFLLFSITGFKSVVFYPVLLFICKYLFEVRTKNLFKYLIWGICSGISICIIIEILFDFSALRILFIQREIIINGLLTGYFYEYFSQNPKALLGYSILKDIVTYPYSDTPSNLIGNVYFGSLGTTQANVNIWADGYSNFGHLGIIGSTIITGIYFWIYDSLTKNYNLPVRSLLIIIPSLSLISSGILTALFTYGLVFMLIICWLLPNIYSKENKVKNG